MRFADVIVITMGAEQFGSAEVGPISYQTTIGEGEKIEDAYARASTIAHKMFEAEFSVKIQMHARRRAEVQRERSPSGSCEEKK